MPPVWRWLLLITWRCRFPALRHRCLLKKIPQTKKMQYLCAASQKHQKTMAAHTCAPDSGVTPSTLPFLNCSFNRWDGAGRPVSHVHAWPPPPCELLLPDPLICLTPSWLLTATAGHPSPSPDCIPWFWSAALSPCGAADLRHSLVERRVRELGRPVLPAGVAYGCEQEMSHAYFSGVLYVQGHFKNHWCGSRGSSALIARPLGGSPFAGVPGQGRDI